MASEDDKIDLSSVAVTYLQKFLEKFSLGSTLLPYSYRKTSNISRTLVSNKIVDNSDVVGASPVGAAPTTSSFST